MKTRNPHDQVVTEYRRLANAYDRKWSFYIEATTRETIARLSLRAKDRLLDIGCGTGALLHRLAAVHPVSRPPGAPVFRASLAYEPIKGFVIYIFCSDSHCCFLSYSHY